MRVVYMGTPQLAARVLDVLSVRHEVVLAITRPDAVSGRGSKKRPSAVKERAQDLGIAIIEAAKIDQCAIDSLLAVNPDAVCVAAYGCILPKEVLELPRYGCLNVHMSLLPRWRGAAPIERAILAGDEVLGFSIMRMEEGLDTGPYCRQGAVLSDGKHMPELEEELAVSGAEALCDVLDELASGQVEWTCQDEPSATYAEKIGKGELAIMPSDTVRKNWARVRASSEAHPSRTCIAEREVRIERAAAVQDESLLEVLGTCTAGTARFVQKRLFLACADGWLEIKQIKPSGKNSMDAKAFCAGVKNFKNESKQWG